MRNALRARSSALMPPETHPFRGCSLWTDVRLARALRHRSGILIGTHPSLNILAADVSRPGLITVGQEHMHLHAHDAPVRRAIARMYPRLDALVVLTDRDARAYTEQVAAPIKLEVIPNTVRVMEGGRASLDTTTILAAGRLTPQKGFDLLVHAFAGVAATHPDWRLRICGGGHQRQALQQLIDEQRLADVVGLAGPARRLGDAMEQASLFVLSSRFEGFPLTLLEAMSKGLPVVSFDCPTGPGDIIEDHRNGILVPAGDVDALAGGMLELIADDALRRRLGAAATLTANHYTTEALGPRWEKLFDELRRRPDKSRDVVRRRSEPMRDARLAPQRPADRARPQRRRLAAHIDEEAREIIRSVKPRTMTAPQKLYALIIATRYVVHHEIPGSIVECGVWRGGSMQAVARTLLAHGVTDRDLHLFDTFKGMPPPTDKDRRPSGKLASELLASRPRTRKVWAVASLEDVRSGMAETGYPSARVHFHPGMVEETVPAQAPDRVAILRLDTDWYESTRHELEHLYERVPSGGVLIFDDYGFWQGARQAIDEFLECTGERLPLLPMASGRITIKP